MRYRIHYEIGGFHDYVDLIGSFEEIQRNATSIIEEKNPDNYWSEALADDPWEGLVLDDSEKDVCLSDLWLNEFLDKDSGLCGLCGNKGIITGQPRSPAGILLNPQKHYCICPNGRALKKMEHL